MRLIFQQQYSYFSKNNPNHKDAIVTPEAQEARRATAQKARNGKKGRQ